MGYGDRVSVLGEKDLEKGDQKVEGKGTEESRGRELNSES